MTQRSLLSRRACLQLGSAAALAAWAGALPGWAADERAALAGSPGFDALDSQQRAVVWLPAGQSESKSRKSSQIPYE